MHLIEILLPVADNRGQAFDQKKFDDLREVLTRKFGGLTTFARSPAQGYWRPDSQSTHIDDVVVFEVMVDNVEDQWWADLRKELERTFEQTEIVIRSHAIRRL
jgi:hypothetical protein